MIDALLTTEALDRFGVPPENHATFARRLEAIVSAYADDQERAASVMSRAKLRHQIWKLYSLASKASTTGADTDFQTLRSAYQNLSPETRALLGSRRAWGERSPLPHIEDLACINERLAAAKALAGLCAVSLTIPDEGRNRPSGKRSAPSVQADVGVFVPEKGGRPPAMHVHRLTAQLAQLYIEMTGSEDVKRPSSEFIKDGTLAGFVSDTFQHLGITNVSVDKALRRLSGEIRKIGTGGIVRVDAGK